MTEGGVFLRADDFRTAMPFGFLSDAAGVLQTVGTALQRCLGIEPGSRVDEHFVVVRPPRTQSFCDLDGTAQQTVQLRSRNSDLELKGSIVAAPDSGTRAFFGTAIVRDINEFQQLGLRINDFPPSDATPDLLLSMQATRTALDDARKLGGNLQAALANAKAASEAKARFLAVMSHEIRTPLNGFGSMIDLLRDSRLDEDQLEQLDTMDLCAQSLLVLVNDILDFSKLEVDKVVLERKPVMLNDAVEQIVDLFRATALERGIELRLVSELADSDWLMLDYQRVRQVLSNLVGNALKFTEAGRVEVRLSIADLQGVIDVIDTGVGIPECSRAQLFEPFVQGDSSATRRFGGTGLGLAISRQLAQAMGGDIELLRSDETGTHFRFTFYAPHTYEATPAVVPGSADATEDFAGVRVLIVEDDLTNQTIAQRMLKKLAAETAIAPDGEAAVQLAAREHYDLILMDLMMPKMNGIEATRRIRSSSGPCQHVPIVAFSAAAFESDREAAKAAGMSGFIEKPARLAILRGVLRRYVGVDKAR